MKKRRFKTRLLRSLALLFILVNVVAAFHAYKFTHYDPAKTVKTTNPDKIGWGEKIKTLFTGVNNPRPRNTQWPDKPYETITLSSNKRLEGWLIKAADPKGTVIIFHGYGGHRSSMLDKADYFLSKEYNTFLIDFMGSGGSEGNQTTIGFYESVEVKDAFDFIKNTGEKNILLFGTSMGAAAIMKAVSEHSIAPAGIIVECPFGTMVETVEARFRAMGVPAFPMARLLVFWGGLENNFNAFAHNPAEYAENIQCPTLLLYGEKDIDVSREETDRIFNNLKGPKTLCTYPLSGHENYLKRYKEKWSSDVDAFIGGLPAVP